MRIDNLVFNKIGNSLSIMLFSDNGSLQLWDETDFLYKSIPVSLKGLLAKEYLELYIEFSIRDKKLEATLRLDDSNGFFKAENYLFPVDIGDEEIILKINDANLVFKLSFGSFQKLRVEGEVVKINEKDFLKGFTEFVLFLYS